MPQHPPQAVPYEVSTWVPLCAARELRDGDLAVPFDVVYGGQTCRAFVVRAKGRVSAFLNRCSHVAMEMDYQPNRFFDDSGQWLICATHGATYDPASGACRDGPCRGGLVTIATREHDGVVFWGQGVRVKAVEF
jgi:nitrite reductase/ring-hydroxylating ferredoxin subunit